MSPLRLTAVNQCFPPVPSFSVSSQQFFLLFYFDTVLNSSRKQHYLRSPLRRTASVSYCLLWAWMLNLNGSQMVIIRRRFILKPYVTMLNTVVTKPACPAVETQVRLVSSCAQFITGVCVSVYKVLWLTPICVMFPVIYSTYSCKNNISYVNCHI